MALLLTSTFILLLVVSCTEGWWVSDKDRVEEEKSKCLAKPQDDSKLNVEFFLYTRLNEGKAYQMSTVPDPENSPFSSDRNSVFIIHGYTDEGSTKWIQDIKTELLKYFDLNVIAVNWEKGADSLYYGQSAANTRRVGEIIGDFIMEIVKVSVAELSSFHLIGHSLGAHIAGYAGARTGGKVGRVTGLDPAGPCFRFSPTTARLSSDDAVFVDAIHTDGDSLAQGGFGTELRMGDADFYPNGGEKQPGCASWFWEHLLDLFKNWIEGFTSSVACNHLRVLDLFRESINPENSFKAYPCEHQNNFKDCKTCDTEGCSRMGYYADPNRHGIFTLRTHKTSPFSYDY